MQIDFQNEILVARLDGRTIASVPDLICILETEGARAALSAMNVGRAWRRA
jgi:DUF917 family protein